MSRFPIKNNPAFGRMDAGVWNEAHPVGSKVMVRLDSGVPFETVTTSRAYTAQGALVVKVKGLNREFPVVKIRPGWDE